MASFSEVVSPEKVGMEIILRANGRNIVGCCVRLLTLLHVVALLGVVARSLKSVKL